MPTVVSPGYPNLTGSDRWALPRDWYTELNLPGLPPLGPDPGWSLAGHDVFVYLNNDGNANAVRKRGPSKRCLRPTPPAIRHVVSSSQRSRVCPVMEAGRSRGPCPMRLASVDFHAPSAA